MKIGNLPVGEFIRQARIQRKITQVHLASDIMDATSLAHLEKGTRFPTREKIVQILERLGFDGDIIDAADEQRKSEIRNALYYENVTTAEELLLTLEKDNFFMSEINNLQFIYMSKATISTIKNESPLMVREIVMAGLKITLPFFQEKYIQEYLLTGNDITLINQLAISYKNEGNHCESIKIQNLLIENIETNCIDFRHNSRYYPYLIYGITKHLGEIGEYKKAIPLCDKGIAMCHKTNNFTLLPDIMLNKACCLCETNNIPEGIKLLLTTTHMYMAYGFDAKVALIKDYASANWEKFMNYVEADLEALEYQGQ